MRGPNDAETRGKGYGETGWAAATGSDGRLLRVEPLPALQAMETVVWVALSQLPPSS